MQLALVLGSCTATVKDPSLHGHKLTVVRVTDARGEPVADAEVALDVTGASPGQLVLVARGSSARQPQQTRSVAADLTIVGIVDDLTTPAEKASAGTTRNRRK